VRGPDELLDNLGLVHSGAGDEVAALQGRDVDRVVAPGVWCHRRDVLDLIA
jgi:hypothetical protein